VPSTIELTVTSNNPSVSATFTELHGLACRLFEGPDSPVQHHAQHKRFSIGPLIYRPDGAFSWHAAWLCDDIPPSHLQPGSPPITAHLGGHAIVVEPVAVQHQPFDSLAARRGRHAELVFISPTSFSRSGHDSLLPDPHLIFGGLARRWALFAPPELRPPDGIGSDLGYHVMVTSLDIVSLPTSRFAGLSAHESPSLHGTYRIETNRQPPGRPVPAQPRSGFVGTVTLELLEPQLESWFAPLAEFANFAGVGRATTHGCGAVRARLHSNRNPAHTMSVQLPRRDLATSAKAERPRRTS
jgi:CRISPR-associated endoribonuclease Cas6